MCMCLFSGNACKYFAFTQYQIAITYQTVTSIQGEPAVNLHEHPHTHTLVWVHTYAPKSIHHFSAYYLHKRIHQLVVYCITHRLNTELLLWGLEFCVHKYLRAINSTYLFRWNWWIIYFFDFTVSCLSHAYF